MNLAQLPLRTGGIVTASTLPHREQRRLTELGLRQGARVQVWRRAPFGGPLAIRVGEALLALRVSQAAHILVTAESHDA
jgi:Fe2+ transport system protein FeoA